MYLQQMPKFLIIRNLTLNNKSYLLIQWLEFIKYETMKLNKLKKYLKWRVINNWILDFPCYGFNLFLLIQNSILFLPFLILFRLPFVHFRYNGLVLLYLIASHKLSFHNTLFFTLHWTTSIYFTIKSHCLPSPW